MQLVLFIERECKNLHISCHVCSLNMHIPPLVVTTVCKWTLTTHPTHPLSSPCEIRNAQTRSARNVLYRLHCLCSLHTHLNNLDYFILMCACVYVCEYKWAHVFVCGRKARDRQVTEVVQCSLALLISVDYDSVCSLAYLLLYHKVCVYFNKAYNEWHHQSAEFRNVHRRNSTDCPFRFSTLFS